jgi:hypothetical protein
MKKKLTIVFIIYIILSITIMPCIYANNFNGQHSSCESYAVIVVGRYAGILKHILPKNFQQYYRWYLNSAGMTYSMLKDTYGYTDDHIFLLVSLRERYDIPDSFDANWIDYPATKENLKLVLDKFKPGGEIWMKDTDTFVFTYINHGLDEKEKDNGKYAHDTFFGFPFEFESIRDILSYYIFKQNQEDYKLYDWELAEYIENIHSGKKLFILQPCYSGGFINDLSGINHIICTASRETEVAAQSWIEPFIRGLGGKADANGDEKISILEAYEYAARKVHEKTSSEHPLLDDNDDGIGHHYSEVGYDPTNPNSDGYVSARTYL